MRPTDDGKRRPYVWYLTTVDDLEQMRAKAAKSDPKTLRQCTREHNKKVKLDEEVQRALWDAGIKQCATCTAPIGNPHDPEYPEKLKRIEKMWEAPLPKCMCRACA